ncbi:glycosyltransferase family 39 protein [Algihabitans albus]|uniref:ArnT family glycosyltransferase n=1 Tax=Algihabitans albus TaxID=2164067 RepID=UPI0035CF47A1
MTAAALEREGRRGLDAWMYLALALVALAFFLPGFFDLPPIDRDEARFAQASKQMLESGDFVDIRFQDEGRHKKPVGIYWMQAAAAAAAGGPDAAEIWVYRLPSLLGATLAVLLTAWAGVRLVGPQAALFGALMMAGCILLSVEARMAKTDAMLLASIVLAQGALARIYLDWKAGRATGFGTVALFWVALGLGGLIKGPINVMVSALTLVALCGVERNLGWLGRLRSHWGLPLALLIVLPWLVAIQIQTDGAFFREAVGGDLLSKVAQGQEAHGAPPGYYLLTFWITFWPFSLLAGLAVPWVWVKRRTPEVRFLLAWILPTWIVFELVVTKLLHYTLPTFPAIALLAAAAGLAGWQVGRERLERWSRRISVWLFAGVSAALGIAVIGAPIYLTGRVSVAALFAVLPLAAMAVYVLRNLDGAPFRNLIVALTAGGFLFAAPVWEITLDGLDPLRLSPRLAERVEAVRPCPETVLASGGYGEPSLVFLLGTETRVGIGGEGAAEALLADPVCGLAAVTQREMAAFQAVLQAAGAEAEALESLEGLNYSRGDDLVITLFRLKP